MKNQNRFKGFMPLLVILFILAMIVLNGCYSPVEASGNPGSIITDKLQKPTPVAVTERVNVTYYMHTASGNMLLTEDLDANMITITNGILHIYLDNDQREISCGDIVSMAVQPNQQDHK